jgi:hypothetical protein
VVELVAIGRGLPGREVRRDLALRISIDVLHLAPLAGRGRIASKMRSG